MRCRIEKIFVKYAAGRSGSAGETVNVLLSVRSKRNFVTNTDFMCGDAAASRRCHS